MKWLLAALGLLMVAAGGYWAFTGSLIVQVERGWSAVIAGSVVFSTGFLILALTALLGSVNRLAQEMRDARNAGARPDPATPQHVTVASAANKHAEPTASAEPEDKSQLRLELVSSPPPVPVQHAFMPPAPQPVAAEETPSAPVHSASRPRVETPIRPTTVEDNSASAQSVDAAPAASAAGASAPQADGAPPQAMRPAPNPPGRPSLQRPAPPAPVGRPVPPPPAARVRAIHPGLAPPPPPPRPQQDSAEKSPAPQAQPVSEAPVPAPREASAPRKVGWLEQALEGASPGDLASLKPVTSPAAPTPRASSVKDAPARIAEHKKNEETPAAASSQAPAVEAKTDDAVKKAENGETEAIAPAVEAAKPATPEADPEPAPEVKPPPEPVRLPVAKSDDFQLTPPAKRIPEPPPLADLPKITRKYESQGVSYTLYEDGSIDADSTSGRFRFASLDELRVFLEKKS
ncbi:MAG: hypothetical protein Q8M31_13750 [Beijerinckiaceae bacterium]|nr:hypothetical protein [Beijerinckiaceae bacterium]